MANRENEARLVLAWGRLKAAFRSGNAAFRRQGGSLRFDPGEPPLLRAPVELHLDADQVFDGTAESVQAANAHPDVIGISIGGDDRFLEAAEGLRAGISAPDKILRGVVGVEV